MLFVVRFSSTYKCHGIKKSRSTSHDVRHGIGSASGIFVVSSRRLTATATESLNISNDDVTSTLFQLLDQVVHSSLAFDPCPAPEFDVGWSLFEVEDSGWSRPRIRQNFRQKYHTEGNETAESDGDRGKGEVRILIAVDDQGQRGRD